MRRPLEIEVPLTVRTYDIDYAGTVSNIVYVRWLEDIRLTFLETYFPLEKQIPNGFGPVLLHTKIDYRRTIRLLDKPVGKLWLRELTPTRWFLEIEIRVNDQIVATAQQSGCFVNLATGRPIPIPEEMARLYREYGETKEQTT